MDTEAVKEIQHYLRTLSYRNPTILPVVVDGIYGHDTVKAVSAFQQLSNIPVSGKTDSDTWYALTHAYDQATRHPLSLQVFPDKNAVINQSSPAYLIVILQAMLRVFDESVSLNGIYDSQTKQLIETFQSQHHLPVTGDVDEISWNTLSALFNGRRFKE